VNACDLGAYKIFVEKHGLTPNLHTGYGIPVDSGCNIVPEIFLFPQFVTKTKTHHGKFLRMIRKSSGSG
jgi:hypothetical protein